MTERAIRPAHRAVDGPTEVWVPYYADETHRRAQTDWGMTWGGKYTAVCEHGLQDVEYSASTHHALTSCPCPPGTPPLT
jgi:hypothetical protein